MAAHMKRILIECGAAETRAALVDGEEVLRFWFRPARGDEAWSRPPQVGECLLGRVRMVVKPLRGAFIDIGADRDGFLPFVGDASPISEGERSVFVVKRPAIGDKGPVLSLNWRQGRDGAEIEAVEREAQTARKVGSFITPKDSAIVAFIAADTFDRRDCELAIVDDAGAAALLREYGADVEIENCPFEKYTANEALEAAFDRIVALPGGARMTVDETEGLTVVDVDAGAAADGATGRLNDKVNLAAAKPLYFELSRRAIGGRVVVDFLPPSGAKARADLKDALREARRGVYDCRIGRLSEDGLFDLTAPREHLSLLEQATEPSGADWPRPGRRFTLDWQAKSAIRALERRLVCAPSARVRLIAQPAIAVFIAARPQWGARLAARFGARFDTVASEDLKDRRFDVVER